MELTEEQQKDEIVARILANAYQALNKAIYGKEGDGKHYPSWCIPENTVIHMAFSMNDGRVDVDMKLDIGDVEHLKKCDQCIANLRKGHVAKK